MPGLFEDIAPVFGMCRSSDGPEYWDDIEQRHRDHRRHTRRLVIVAGLFSLAGLVAHPSFFALAIIVLPLLVLELVMVRVSRPNR
jgi:hypothetical protein